VNPIIYNHTSKDFRDAFRSAFSSTRRPSQSSRRQEHGDGGFAAECSSRVVGGLQRSMKAPDAAHDAVDVTRENAEDNQHHDDIDSLSHCSNRVHLDD